MFKQSVSIVLILSMILLTGCYTLNHTVGNGPQGNTVVSKKQWYVLFGLVPLNNVDSKQMAAGASDYQVTSKWTFVDIVIGIFTGLVSVYPTTITVTK